MASCSDFKKRLWTAEEDCLLKQYIQLHGEGHWSTIPKTAGLLRSGRSCRSRWMNHLRPNVKHGNISQDEEELIIRLHKLLGNRWSLIAGRIPGRTDHEVKNYWYSQLKHRVGIKVTRPSVARLTDKPNNLAKSLPTAIESAKTAAIWKGEGRESQGLDIIVNVGEEEKEPSKCDAVDRDGILSHPSAPNVDELSSCTSYLSEESISLLDLYYGQQNEMEQWF